MLCPKNIDLFRFYEIKFALAESVFCCVQSAFEFQGNYLTQPEV